MTELQAMPIAAECGWTLEQVNALLVKLQNVGYEITPLKDAAEGKVTETWRVEYRRGNKSWSRFLMVYLSEAEATAYCHDSSWRCIHVTATERIVATRTREEGQ
jgi:tryptophan 2,3-dioxygenase